MESQNGLAERHARRPGENPVINLTKHLDHTWIEYMNIAGVKTSYPSVEDHWYSSEIRQFASDATTVGKS